MKEKISVKDFVNEFVEKKIMNNKINDHAVEDFIRSKLAFVDYLPFVEKREMCETVLEASCTKNGAIIEVDSVSRYILFTISVLSKYTNLTFENTDGEDAIDQYDMLCQSGLLNYILGAITGEYEVCNNILNMMMADIDANNNNVAAVFDKALQNVLGSVDKLVGALANKVEDWELDLNQIDIDKIMGVINKFPKK
jgi:hypothetical protein